MSFFEDMHWKTTCLSPAITQEQVRSEIENRFASIPARDDIRSFMKNWESRAQEIDQACNTLDGVHRWIDGKILLRDVLYQDVIEFLPDYAQRSKQEFVEQLAIFAKESPPQELCNIFANFGITVF